MGKGKVTNTTTHPYSHNLNYHSRTHAPTHNASLNNTSPVLFLPVGLFFMYSYMPLAITVVLIVIVIVIAVVTGVNRDHHLRKRRSQMIKIM